MKGTFLMFRMMTDITFFQVKYMSSPFLCSNVDAFSLTGRRRRRVVTAIIFLIITFLMLLTFNSLLLQN